MFASVQRGRDSATPAPSRIPGDDVAVVDFLSGHLPDVFALLRLRGDQPLLNEHLQRFPDGGSADPELLREDGLFDRSADFQRAFTDK